MKLFPNTYYADNTYFLKESGSWESIAWLVKKLRNLNTGLLRAKKVDKCRYIWSSNFHKSTSSSWFKSYIFPVLIFSSTGYLLKILGSENSSERSSPLLEYISLDTIPSANLWNMNGIEPRAQWLWAELAAIRVRLLTVILYILPECLQLFLLCCLQFFPFIYSIAVNNRLGI